MAAGLWISISSRLKNKAKIRELCSESAVRLFLIPFKRQWVSSKKEKLHKTNERELESLVMYNIKEKE